MIMITSVQSTQDDQKYFQPVARFLNTNRPINDSNSHREIRHKHVSITPGELYSF